MPYDKNGLWYPGPSNNTGSGNSSKRQKMIDEALQAARQNPLPSSPTQTASSGPKKSSYVKPSDPFNPNLFTPTKTDASAVTKALSNFKAPPPGQNRPAGSDPNAPDTQKGGSLFKQNMNFGDSMDQLSRVGETINKIGGTLLKQNMDFGDSMDQLKRTGAQAFEAFSRADEALQNTLGGKKIFDQLVNGKTEDNLVSEYQQYLATKPQVLPPSKFFKQELGAMEENRIKLKSGAKASTLSDQAQNISEKTGEVAAFLAGGQATKGMQLVKGAGKEAINLFKKLARIPTGQGALKATPTLANSVAQSSLEKVGNAAVFGAAQQFTEGALVPNIEGRNLAQTFGASLVQKGTGDTLHQAGAAADYLGFKKLGMDLKLAGERQKEGFEVEAPEGPLWQKIMDPNFYATTVASTLPTTLALLPFGLLGSTAGTMGAAAMGFGTFGRTVMGALGASSLTAPIEAAMEAGMVYEQTGDHKAADKVFWRNMALLGVTNSLEFGSMFAPKGLTRTLDSLGGRVAIGALSGATEETVQDVISSDALGLKYKFDPEQAFIGGLISGGMSFIGGINQAEDHINSIKRGVFENLSDEEQVERADNLKDALAQGLTTEQADDIMLEHIAEHKPEKIQEVVSAEMLMAQERQLQIDAKSKVIVPTGGAVEEARSKLDPHETLIGFNPLGQKQEPVVQPTAPTSQRPQGPVQQFSRGETVRLQGLPGAYQVTDDLQGKKRKITGPDGKVLEVFPQALRKFEGLAKGDQVTVSGRDGVFNIADLRDGKRIRVTDQNGKEFHFDAGKLTPSFSAPVAATEKMPEIEQPSAIEQPSEVITPALQASGASLGDGGSFGDGMSMPSEQPIDMNADPKTVFDAMRKNIPFMTAKTAAGKARRLKELVDYGDQHGFEVPQRYRDLYEKFNAESVDEKEVKDTDNIEKKKEKEEKQEREEQQQEKMTRLRQDFTEEAKKHDTFDAFQKFMSNETIPSELRGSQSSQSFIRDVYAEAHGDKPLSERNPYNGRVGDSVTFEGPNGNELTGTISKMIDDELVGVDVPREDGKGTIPYKVYADDIKQETKPVPESKADVAVGDTVTLRGMGEQKFTVDAMKAKGMLSLTSEKGGKLEVHKQAVVSIVGSSKPAEQKAESPTPAAPAVASEKFQSTEKVDGGIVSVRAVIQDGKVTITAKAKNLDHELLPRGFDENTPQLLSYTFNLSDWQKAESSHGNPHWARKKFIEKQINVDKVREKLDHSPMIERIMDAQIKAITKTIELMQPSENVSQPEQKKFKGYYEAGGMESTLKQRNPSTYAELMEVVNAYNDEHGVQKLGGLKVGDFIRTRGSTSEGKDQKGKSYEIFFSDHFAVVIGFSENVRGEDRLIVGYPFKPLYDGQLYNVRHGTAIKEAENMNFIPEEYRHELSLADGRNANSSMEQRREQQARYDEIVAIAKGEKKELSDMSKKELEDEARGLRVPAWGSKDEVIPRIKKARKAQSALAGKTEENLQGMKIVDLEAIMLDADMLPTESGHERNKANHIKRLLEWRDGKKAAVTFEEITQVDFSELNTLTDKQREMLGDYQSGKANTVPYATYNISQESERERIFVQFMVQTPVPRGFTGVGRIIEPDGLIRNVSEIEIGMMKEIYENQLALEYIKARQPKEEKAPEPTKAENLEEHQDKGVVEVRPGFTIKKGDYVNANGFFGQIRGINKAREMVMMGGSNPTAFKDLQPLETLVTDKEKQSIREFIGNDMAAKYHLLRVAIDTTTVLNNRVVFNTDDGKFGTMQFTHDNTGKQSLEILTGPMKVARKPKGPDWQAGGRNDKGGEGFQHENFVTLWEIPESFKQEAEGNAPLNPEVIGTNNTPSQLIANELKDLIRQGSEIKSSDLFRISDNVYKGSQAKGTYSPKDAYDALELAVNQYLLEQTDIDFTTRDAAVVKANVEKLIALTSKLPTQSKRTEEQELFQQFSTPPAIAYVASWIANITNTDTVLEPSAGIGGLALFGKANGAEVVVNELDPRRLEIIKQMPFDQFYKEDGEQINNILPKSVKPTKVIMNPPFSTAATRGVKDTKNSFNHVDQALKRLENGGRLVAILGLHRTGNSRAFTDWISKLQERGFSVRAVVGIDGKNYAKYGTTFNVQYIVIDKVANMGPMGSAFNTKVDTLDEVINLMGGIANDNAGTVGSNNGSQQDAPQSTDSANTGKNPTTRPNTDDSGSRNPPRTAANVGNNGSQNQDTGNESGSNVQPIDEVRTDEDSTEDDGGVNDVRGRNDDLQDDATGNTAGDSRESTGSVDKQEDRPRSNKPVKELSDAVFEEYEPTKLNVRNAVKHPGKLSESAAMAAIEAPDLTYKLSLPKDLIETGKLSNAQLEVVAYAGQAHGQMLRDGKTRRGFFVGDGTGLGKGREMAGIIIDNFQQGRTKAVWVSENKGLLPSARRDWSDLDGITKEIFGVPKLAEPISQERGVLFTTYNTMASGMNDTSGKGKQSRLDQMVKWLGKDFDGVIIFDEAHNMANSVATKGKRGVKKASQKALAGVELQNALPNARIVYASATGATEVSNLGYAARLGLWGAGTAFSNQIDFISKIVAGGIAAMELVARDMKAMGLYIARNLSYDGVEYQKLTHNLSGQQTEIYDVLAQSWQIVLQNIHAALETIGVTEDGKAKDGQAAGRAIGQFWGAQQRFFNQVLTAMQMPTVIAEAKKDLAAGKSIVMQLVNTNAASQDRQVSKIEEEEGDLEDLDLTPKQILMQFIENSFPIQQFEDYIDDKGNQKSRPVVDSNGNPVINQEALAMKDDLLQKLDSIKVPQGPLEMVFEAFGVEMVAEITGRQQRVVMKENKNTGRLESILEKRTPQAVEADSEAFMNGNKRILVFSNAGGTGRSYHASRTVKNQQQRMHYLIQAGWEATKAVQGFGRTHRTNQSSAPVYKLFTTNLKGQMRFVSSIARRLDQLGALTKGQRQTGSQGLFSAADNLESNIAKRALVRFYDLLIAGQLSLDKREVLRKMGLDGKLMNEGGRLIEDADEVSDVPKFLNRILTLESGLQNEVFETFQGIVVRMTEIALQDGTLDNGMESIKADTTKILEEQEIRKDAETNSVTKYIKIETGNKSIKMKLKDLQKDEDYVGVYRNARSKAIKVIAKRGTKTLENGSVVDRYIMQGAEYYDYEYIDQVKLDKSTWAKLKTKSEVQEDFNDTVLALQAAGLSETEATAKAVDELLPAEDLWEAAVKAVPKHRKTTLHMISGTLLPIWDRLPTDNVRVVRALTDDGEMLLGRIIPEAAINQTLFNLGAERRSQEVNKDTLADQILEDGYTVRLTNNWKLSRRMVSGDWRIELSGDLYGKGQELRDAGLFMERVGSDYRWFVPTGEAATDSIKALTKHRPIAEVVPPRNGQQSGSRTQGYTAPNAHVHRGITPTQTQTVAPGKMIKRSTIYKHINKKFDVPIGTGRYRKRALGIYTTHINEIRTKNYGDFVVLTHELGHRLDDKYGFSTQPANSNELMILASFLQIPKGMKLADKRAEGFAEFIRRYFYDPQSAQAYAPLLYDQFEDVMRQNRQYQAVRDLNDMLQTWHYQGSFEKADSVIALGGKKEQSPLKDRLGQLGDRLYEELGGIDRAIRSFYPNRKERRKNMPQGAKNPYHVAWRNRGIAGRIEAFLHYGVVDGKGNKIGPSLEEVLASVPSVKTFRQYVFALRAQELHDQGRWKTPLSDAEAYDIIQAVEKGTDGQKYKDAVSELYLYQDAVTDVLVDGGFLSRTTVAEWRNEHLFYVPFYRVMTESGSRQDEAEKRNDTGSNRMGNLQNPVKGMRDEGSERDVIDPLESIIKNTYMFLSLASRNEVGTTLLDFLEDNPDSARLAAVVPNKVKGTTFNLIEIANALEAAGVNLSDPKIDLNRFTTVFRQTFNPDPTTRILNVWRNGNIVQVQIRSEDLYEGMLMLESAPVSKAAKFFGWPNIFFKAGIVLSPAFIPKNFMRGLPTMLMQSDSFTTPKDYLDLFPMLAKNFASSFLQDQAYWKWMSTGGAHTTLNSITETYLTNSSDSLLRSNYRDILIREAKTLGIGAVLKGLRYVAGLGDNPIRMAEHQKAMEKTGDPVLAAVRSRDVDMDFNRLGKDPFIKSLNTLNAFFNVAIQGPNRVYRSFRDHPFRTMARGLTMITAPTLLLYLLNRDDEDYWKLPQWERDLFWIIPTGMEGPLKYIKIPIPFEWGLIFKTLPERIFASNAAFGDKGGKAFDQLGQTAVGIFVPTLIPTVLAPMIEWITGDNFISSLSATPIVPERLIRKAPEDQYRSTTTETAKMIGKLTGTSPLKVENTITGVTGTLGSIGLNAVDSIMKITGITDPPEKPAGTSFLGLGGDQGLFARSYFTSPETKGSQLMEDFYNRLDKFELAHKNDVRRKGYPPNDLKQLRKTQDQLSAIRNIQELIRLSKNTSPDEKRVILDKMAIGLNDLAAVALGQKADDPANMRKIQSYAMNYGIVRENVTALEKYVDKITRSSKE